MILNARWIIHFLTRTFISKAFVYTAKIVTVLGVVSSFMSEED